MVHLFASCCRLTMLASLLIVAIAGTTSLAAAQEAPPPTETEVPGEPVGTESPPATDVPVETETPPTESPTEPTATEPPVEHDTVLVNAILCADAACEDVTGMLQDFEISVWDEGTSDLIDTCVTDPDARAYTCELDIPMASAWYLGYEPSAVPAGYAYKGVLVPEPGTEPFIYTLAFIKEGAATESPATHEPVTALPATGSGTGHGPTSTVLALAAGTLLATSLIVTSRTLNRR